MRSDWDNLIKDFKNLVKEKTKKEFPQNVKDQVDWSNLCSFFILGKS